MSENLREPLPKGVVRWSFESYGSNAVTPSSAHGRVYVGGASLFALDLATGRVVWERDTDDIADCTPIVVGHTIFVTGGDLLAVDAETGTVRWRRAGTKEGGFHSAAYGNGLLCVGTGPHTLRACDAGTGEDRWHLTLDGYLTAEPRYSDGRWYVSCTESLQAVDASTGKRLWTVGVGSSVLTAPTVSHGRVFVGSGEGDLGVRALDAASGRHLWTCDTAGYVGSAPVIDNDVLYATAAGGKVFTLEPATGRRGWSADVEDTGDGLTVANGNVYVCGTWRLTALDAGTGVPLWSSKPDAFGLCAPLVVDTTVVLCDDSGRVYAVSPPPAHMGRV